MLRLCKHPLQIPVDYCEIAQKIAPNKYPLYFRRL
jgi:hypothetical protein